MKTLLIVDDNADLRDALSAYLTKSGFHVIEAENGDDMWRVLSKNQVDLILLDIMMPGDDGFTLCQKLRQRSDVPIIMLTAVTDEIDRVAGLEMGADDYITKSFSPRELLARIKATLRRTQSNSSPLLEEQRLKPALTRKICFLNWQLDCVTRQLLDTNTEKTTALTASDLSLLMLFVSQPEAILSRDDIAREIWGRDAEPLERGIDVQISRLRNHLNDKDRALILTVRNKGYLFTAKVIYD